ncbi:MAG TPA: DUF58 domain-containing protein [Chloroflexi bacterium]|nr:DUF58 domain-containing protein [Chloroflexota bacterium]
MRVNWIIFLLLPSVLLPALATGQEFLYRLVYLLLAIIVLALLWAWYNSRGIVVERRLRSSRAQVGGLAVERIVARNPGRWPKFWVEIRDHSTLPEHQVGRLLPSMPAGRELSWTVKTLCHCRGEFALGPITLVASDPLGLFQMNRPLPGASSLIVYPMTVPLPGFTPPGGQLSGGDAIRRRTQEITTNVASVRDYLPGDSFNRLHWPSIARTGRLISKEFELDPTADIWLLLDMEGRVQARAPEEAPVEGFPLLRAPRPWRVDPTTEEYGVTIAASLAKHFLAQKKALGVVTYGQRREMVQVDRGERQLSKVLEALAVIRAQGQIPLAEVIAAEGGGMGRGAMAIVITPSTEEGWVAALRELRRRGISAVVIHIEPSTFTEAPSSLGIITLLAAGGFPTYLVKRDQPLEEALSQKIYEGQR